MPRWLRRTLRPALSASSRPRAPVGGAPVNGETIRRPVCHSTQYSVAAVVGDSARQHLLRVEMQSHMVASLVGDSSLSVQEEAGLDVPVHQNTMYEEAKRRTLEIGKPQWQDSLYFKFMQSASRCELLKSQIPFYYAVEAFPRMLCKLAAMVETSEARFLVVENIWEEHGSGKGGHGFHTNTFKTYLKALGWDGIHLERCPLVTDWIKKLLSLDSPQELFLSLAAIEYLYAVISETVTDTLAKHELLCEQDHYKKHSELDWEHGRELLEAMVFAEHEFDACVFDQAQRDFLNIFDSLAFPTVKDMAKLRESQPVAFYYTREDSAVLNEALRLMQDVRSGSNPAEKFSVLLTCSGGEHVFHCLARPDAISSITALDINPEQIRVCQEKLKRMGEVLELDLPEAPLGCEQQATLGRFEFLFAWIRRYLTCLGYRTASKMEQPGDWRCNVTDDHLKYVVGRVFSNDILEAVFTKDATRYTTASFADHFVKVLHALLEELDSSPMARNIFLGEPLPSPIGIGRTLQAQDLPVHYVCGHLQDVSFKLGYDLIDLSNIGDWLPLSSFREIVQQAVAALAPGGALILRRLLGDYDIVTDVLHGLDATEARSLCALRQTKDRTHFYSQTVIALKSPHTGLQAR